MIKVFVDNFTHPNPIRASEIAYCIERNQANPDIVYTLMNSATRMTYQDFFDRINAQTSDDDINIVSNIDIIFDDTITQLSQIDNNTFVALTRWEMLDSGPDLTDKAKYTQDVWAWKGKIRLSGIDFHLGVWGCDNKVAYEAEKAGYQLLNPCYSVMAYHHHKSGIHSEEYRVVEIAGPKSFVFPSKFW